MTPPSDLATGGVVVVGMLMLLKELRPYLLRKKEPEPVKINGNSGERSVDFWRMEFRIAMREELNNFSEEMRQAVSQRNELMRTVIENQRNIMEKVTRLEARGRR